MKVQLDETEIAMIIGALFTGVLACALAMVFALVVICIQREDRRGRLPVLAPTRICRVVRRLCGLRIGPPAQARSNQRAANVRRSA